MSRELAETSTSTRPVLSEENPNQPHGRVLTAGTGMSLAEDHDAGTLTVTSLIAAALTDLGSIADTATLEADLGSIADTATIVIDLGSIA